MKVAKRDFRKALRRCKSNELNIRNENIVKSLRQKNTKQFWTHVRSMKVNKNADPVKIDNAVDPQKMSELFSNKFKSIFSDNNCESSCPNKNFNKANKVSHKTELRIFTTKCISNAISKLNPVIGPDNIHSNHLKYAPEQLYTLISKFYSACFRHSFIPASITKGIILPLIKDEFGDKESADNYRPIISSSVFLKILELSIKTKIEDNLTTNERQFGFKSGSSTKLAYLMFKEVSLTHIKNEGKLFAAFIDISKAFDKVSHEKLFSILEARGFSAEMVNFIRNWYLKQIVCVKFLNSYSSEWRLKTGVRQGGILSPFFFALYIDDVIKKISKLSVGCRINYVMMNIIAFADDVAILAPDAKSIQEILNILNDSLLNLNLRINPSKSSIMLITRNKRHRHSLPNVYIDNNKIPFTRVTKYLGFLIDDCLSNQDDIIKCRNKFYSTFNILLRKFHFLDPSAFFELFRSYCCQIYGAEMWYSGFGCHSLMRKFAVGYHKAIKKICKCPYYVSNTFVCNHYNVLKFEHYINSLQIKFAFNLFKSKNILINKLKDHFKFQSPFVHEICNMVDKNYDIKRLANNDCDAIMSRVWYVQRNQAHSQCFVLL